ncbi:MAG: Fic family protein [Chloroflexota bacterium]
MSTNQRAGKYIQQPTGYRAFVPEPLPPSKPPIQINGNLQIKLSQADRVLGRLDGSILTLPNPDLFVFMYVRKEAVLSSQIEGTRSSLQDILTAEAKILSAELPSDIDEVVNYVHAMNYGLKRLDTLPISVRLIREIHEKLLAGTRGGHLIPGELRTSQNWIGPAGCTLGEADFIPPPKHEVAPSLAQLETFLHTDNTLPLLLKIGLAHAQFETIHPFLDGNGRVGRLLITLLLCEQEVLVKPVLYISHYFKKHRQTYYDQLQAVRDHGSWEAWLEFFVDGVIEVSKEATQTVREILLLREAHRQIIFDQLGKTAGNGQRVLDYLFEHPIISISEIRELLDSSYTAANNLVSNLEKVGIIQEFTGQSRHRRYIYQSYIRLFSD